MTQLQNNKMDEQHEPTEINGLLSQDDVELSRFKLQIVPRDDDSMCSKDSDSFDPFVGRDVENPTSDCQTLTHLLKSTLGSGIMSMPYAFKSAGILGGLLGGLFTAAVCTHTSYILVQCAHILYYRTKKKKMDYAEIMEAAFATGPERVRKYSKIARYTVLVGIFATYFGASSADNLLIATNFGQIYNYYQYASDNNTAAAAELAMCPVQYSLLRIIMSIVMPILILFVWVPDLKYLAPISTIANVFMAVVLGISFYYVVQNPQPISELSLSRPITEYSQFFAITLFAMENIGVMMPLENNMKTPKNFLGKCGVLNRGMLGITFIYLILGVFGYIKYGDNVNSIITTNLPIAEPAAQTVKILIGSTVLFTFSLQFYVCREMAWNCVKDRFPKRPFLAEYTLRAVMVIVCVCIAIGIPSIGPLISLVGAVGFSSLGLIGPVLVEIITYWDIGFGRFNWRIYKNVIILIFGIYILCFGSYNVIANEMLADTPVNNCEKYVSL